jgi:hypothetical protein
MHRFAKLLFVLGMVIHIVPSAAFADRLVDGVPIPNDAKVVPPSAAAPESQQGHMWTWSVPTRSGPRYAPDPRQRRRRT